MEERPKFGIAETFLWTVFALTVDGICALIDITGVGMAIAPFIQGLGTIVFGFVLINKGNSDGLKTGRLIFKLLLHILPATPYIITALTTTIPFWVETFIHNHPKFLEKATAFAQTKLGGKVLGKVLPT